LLIGISDYFDEDTVAGTNDMKILDEKLQLPKFFKNCFMGTDKNEKDHLVTEKDTFETKKLQKEVKSKFALLKSIRQSKTAKIYNAIKNVRFLDLVNEEKNPEIEAKINNYIKRTFASNEDILDELDYKEDLYHLNQIRFDCTQTSPVFSLATPGGRSRSVEQRKLFGKNLVGYTDDRNIRDLAETYDQIRERTGPIHFKDNKKEQMATNHLLKILNKTRYKTHKNELKEKIDVDKKEDLEKQMVTLKNRGKTISYWDKIMNAGTKDTKGPLLFERRLENFHEMRRELDKYGTRKRTEFYNAEKHIYKMTEPEYNYELLNELLPKQDKPPLQPGELELNQSVQNITERGSKHSRRSKSSIPGSGPKIDIDAGRQSSLHQETTSKSVLISEMAYGHGASGMLSTSGIFNDKLDLTRKYKGIAHVKDDGRQDTVMTTSVDVTPTNRIRQSAYANQKTGSIADGFQGDADRPTGSLANNSSVIATQSGFGPSVFKTSQAAL
jgi:hypothetical protein